MTNRTICKQSFDTRLGETEHRSDDQREKTTEQENILSGKGKETVFRVIDEF